MNSILIVPDPKLRQKTNKIPKVTNNEIKISKKMMDLVQIAPGVGLAANQIGILKKIVTVNIKENETDDSKIYALFNPIITDYSKEIIKLEEGCLSLPKQFAEIERPESIIVKYLNDKNKIIEEKKTGIEARILQHEIDHLSGKLFVDYLSSLKKNILIKKVLKLKKIGDIK